MTRSGTVRTSSYDSNQYRVAVDWSISSQSVSNNSTRLYYKIYAPNSRSSLTWANYYNTKVTINGSTVYNQGSSAKTMYRGDVFKTGSITIPHNSDGTKSVSIYIESGITTSTINKTKTETITLDRIDRGIYDFSLASGWDNIDDLKTITFRKYSSNARVDIKWSYWDNEKRERADEWILRDSSGNSLSGDYSSDTRIRLQSDRINEIHQKNPDYSTATIYITARVYVGSKKIQTFSRQATVRLRVEAPDVSATVKFIGTNQELLGSATRGVQGVHKLQVEASATAKNGATIKRYEIKFNGKKYNSKKIEILASDSGTYDVEVKAVDSRGFNFTVNSATVKVLKYSKPKLISHRAYRVTGGREDPLGETGRISGVVSYDTVSNSSGSDINNPWWRLSIDSGVKTTASILYTQSLDIEDTKLYTLYYGDSFSRAEIKGAIPSGSAPLVIGKKSVGISTVPPENSNGLWIKDSLINGAQAGLIYGPFYADYTVHGYNNYIEAVKANWASLPAGLSFATCRVASQGVAIIYKYTSGDYGAVITFGYGADLKTYTKSQNGWSER